MLELSADTILVKLYAGVTGVTRRTDNENERQDGKALETQRTVTTRQADAQEASRAKKLLNQLRAIVDKHTTTVINISVAPAKSVALLRAEIAPVQLEIDAHNRTAKFHKVDRALVCVPISLKADPAAITEVCRQVADELKVALVFFDPAALSADAVLKSWQTPVDNWIGRTAGLETLFPTITGQMIGEALGSVKELRRRVADSCRAFEKAGQSPESALRSAVGAVAAVSGATGLIENAIGFTAITDSAAKEANDAARAEGNTVAVESSEVH